MPRPEIRKAKAIQVTSQTCVGYFSQEFPYSSGNCFSVETDNGEGYQIVNFCVENLEELILRGVGFPFDIGILSDRVAIIHDSRIPESWYDKDYCEVCCPEDLLPHPQQMAHLRAEGRGERIVGNSWVEIHPDKRPVLPERPTR